MHRANEIQYLSLPSCLCSICHNKPQNEIHKIVQEVIITYCKPTMMWTKAVYISGKILLINCINCNFLKLEIFEREQISPSMLIIRQKIF